MPRRKVVDDDEDYDPGGAGEVQSEEDEDAFDRGGTAYDSAPEDLSEEELVGIGSDEDIDGEGKLQFLFYVLQPLEYIAHVSATGPWLLQLQILSHSVSITNDGTDQNLVLEEPAPRPPIVGRQLQWVPGDDHEADHMPDPYSRVFKANNLQRLKAATIKALQPGRLHASAIRTLARDFIGSKRRRKVTAVYDASKNCILVRYGYEEAKTFRKLQRKRFSCSKLPKAEFKPITEVLVQVMEHFPCDIGELASGRTQWLMAVVKKLAHSTYPEIRPCLDLPVLRPPTTTRSHHVLGKVYGLDLKTKKILFRRKPTLTWRSDFVITLGAVRRDNEIDVPQEYDWSEEWHQDLRVATDKQNLDALDLEQALRLAKLTEATFHGFIGAHADCTEQIKAFQKQYRSDSGRSYSTDKGFGGPFNGRPIWYGPTSTKMSRIRSFLVPSRSVGKAVEGELPPIYMDTHDKLQWYPVLVSMIATSAAGGDVLEIWQSGCTAADEMDQAIREASPPEPVTACIDEDKSGHWHACVYCGNARLCQDLTAMLDFEYPICVHCGETLEEAEKLTLQLPSSPPLLIRALVQAIGMEAKHHGEELSPEQLSERAKAALEELQPYEVYDDGVLQPRQRLDGYVVQELSDRAPVFIDWQGKIVRVKGSTIDAIDPMHATEVNGLIVVGYHAPGNYTITSYSMNMMVKAYPKVHYIAFAQMRDTYHEGCYLSGVQVLRNCLVNLMESHLNIFHQSRRLGRPLPREYTPLKACYRDGTRLESRHVPNDRVWRTVSERVPKNIDAEWRPPKWKYIQDGVREIAAHHGLDDPKYHKHWLRYDEGSDEYVPFFFNEYSVVKSWTVHDFMIWVSVRHERMRNVCDRLYRKYYANNPALRTSFEPEVLIFEIAQQWMRLVSNNMKKNADSVWPEKPPGADSWGIAMFPTVCMLNNLSVAHKTHGKEMKSGYLDRWPEDHGPTSWSFDRSNIEIESVAKNMARWTAPDDALPQIEAQLDNLRGLSEEQIEGKELLRGPIIFDKPILQDELGAVVLDEDENFRLVQDASIDDFAQDETLNPSENDEEDRVTTTVADQMEVTRAPSSSGPSKANLDRMGNSCWFSVIMQLLYNLTELRSLFAVPDFGCLGITGRDKYQDLPEDNDGKFHDELLKALARLFNNLDLHAHGKLPLTFTSGTIDACNKLRTPGRQWSGNATESTLDFFDWLFERIAVGMDRSMQRDGQDPRVALQEGRAHRYENAIPHKPLLHDSAEQWQAFKDVGRESALVDLTTFMFVEERGCSTCGAVYRLILPSRYILFKVPASPMVQHYHMDDICSSWTAVTEDYDEAASKILGQCRRSNCQGTMSDTFCRITRAPEILFVQIDRSLERQAGKTSWVPIVGFETLNMRDWSDFSGLPSREYESEPPLPLTDRYNLAGVLIHRRGMSEYLDHFVIDLAEGIDSKTFVSFDDKQAAPSYVDVHAQLAEPDNYITLLVYRKTKQPLDAEMPLPSGAGLQSSPRVEFPLLFAQTAHSATKAKPSPAISSAQKAESPFANVFEGEGLAPAEEDDYELPPSRERNIASPRGLSSIPRDRRSLKRRPPKDLDPLLGLDNNVTTKQARSVMENIVSRFQDGFGSSSFKYGIQDMLEALLDAVPKADLFDVQRTVHAKFDTLLSDEFRRLQLYESKAIAERASNQRTHESHPSSAFRSSVFDAPGFDSFHEAQTGGEVVADPSIDQRASPVHTRGESEGSNAFQSPVVPHFPPAGSSPESRFAVEPGSSKRKIGVTSKSLRVSPGKRPYGKKELGPAPHFQLPPLTASQGPSSMTHNVRGQAAGSARDDPTDPFVVPPAHLQAQGPKLSICPYVSHLGCDWRSADPKAVSEHVENHDRHILQPCPLHEDVGCKRFLTEEEIKVHLATHKDRFPCPRIFDLGCEARFIAPGDAYKHSVEMHAKMPRDLEHDFLAAARISKLLAEASELEPQYVYCQLCGKPYDIEYEHTMHLIRIHRSQIKKLLERLEDEHGQLPGPDPSMHKTAAQDDVMAESIPDAFTCLENAHTTCDRAFSTTDKALNHYHHDHDHEDDQWNADVTEASRLVTGLFDDVNLQNGESLQLPKCPFCSLAIGVDYSCLQHLLREHRPRLQDLPVAVEEAGLVSAQLSHVAEAPQTLAGDQLVVNKRGVTRKAYVRPRIPSLWTKETAASQAKKVVPPSTQTSTAGRLSPTKATASTRITLASPTKIDQGGTTPGLKKPKGATARGPIKSTRGSTKATKAATVGVAAGLVKAGLRAPAKTPVAGFPKPRGLLPAAPKVVQPRVDRGGTVTFVPSTRQQRGRALSPGRSSSPDEGHREAVIARLKSSGKLGPIPLKQVPCPRIHTHGCGDKFASLDEADQHALVHQDKPPFLCPDRVAFDCFRDFSSKPEAEAHAESFHRSTTRKTKCKDRYSDCRQHLDRGRAEVHELQHEANKYRCPLCVTWVRFADHDSMLRHLRSDHEKDTQDVRLSPDMLRQGRVLAKHPLSEDLVVATYVVQEHGIAPEKANWVVADKIRFHLLYSYEVTHGRNGDEEELEVVQDIAGGEPETGPGNGDKMDVDDGNDDEYQELEHSPEVPESEL